MSLKEKESTVTLIIFGQQTMILVTIKIINPLVISEGIVEHETPTYVKIYGCNNKLFLDFDRNEWLTYLKNQIFNHIY